MKSDSGKRCWSEGINSAVGCGILAYLKRRPQRGEEGLGRWTMKRALESEFEVGVDFKVNGKQYLSAKTQQNEQEVRKAQDGAGLGFHLRGGFPGGRGGCLLPVVL